MKNDDVKKSIIKATIEIIEKSDGDIKNITARKIADKSGVHGSAITVSNFIKMIENQQNGIRKYSHGDLRTIFGLDRQVMLKDVFEGGRSAFLYNVPEPTPQLIGLVAEQSHFLGDN